ncbi:hypothetical protein [uncultured Bosea sp.]|uniref:hypothetical protein n=1 Tax=uncultured Bosea sp. TaxID=211457 RepID=UPI00263AA8A0|nr:hypothetical protein [uncultured Bosea sp.]
MNDDEGLTREELTARLVVLEGFVYTLIEGLLRQAGEQKGMAGVNEIVQTVSFAVGQYSSNLEPDLKEKAHAHFVALLQRLQDRVAPSQSGPVN